MTKLNNKFKGFTIIEVVLVLAIAGLIFLMVFIALPNMQRSQRDTARRQDYANLQAAVSAYLVNNNGNLPGKATDTSTSGTKLVATKYLNTKGQDSSGKGYELETRQLVNAQDSVSTLADLDTDAEKVYVYIVKHADCDGTDATTGAAKPEYNSSNRSFAVYGQLETGTYCAAAQ